MELGFQPISAQDKVTERLCLSKSCAAHGGFNRIRQAQPSLCFLFSFIHNLSLVLSLPKRYNIKYYGLKTGVPSNG